MRNLISNMVLFLTVVAFNSNAALIDNGAYTTDTDSGLDWYDLSFTAGINYNDAGSFYPGWRYASNSEVENIFSIMFPEYSDTVDGAYYSTTTAGSNPNRLSDALYFQNLFGAYADTSWDYSYGMYQDEDNILRMTGASIRKSDMLTNVYGTEFTNNYDSSLSSSLGPEYGVYLVREISAVPVPSAILFFGSGLLGLIGFAWRKSNV